MWLAQSIESRDASLWYNPLTALIMGIRHVALSRWKTDECEAIASELRAWQKRSISEKEGFIPLVLSYFLCSDDASFAVVR